MRRSPVRFRSSAHFFKTMASESFISLKDVQEADQRIAQYIRRTPSIPFDYLNRQLGKEIILKAEIFQKTGSFKFRGAANCVLSQMAQAKKAGVVAASAGNHAQGVASICHLLGISSTIVMPISTPGIKIQNTQRWGAKIELVGNVYDESYDHAVKLSQEQGSLLIHPFKDPLVQAGQGTLGLEILNEPLTKETEAVLISVGGGGLITGVGTVLRALNPKIKIYGLTAQSAPAAYQAVKSKTPKESPVTFTLAEGVATKKTEQMMLDNISRQVDDVFSLSEESIAKAISVLAEQGKMVVEGAGALPVAALLEGLIPEKRVTAVLCGGNIDLPALSAVFRRGMIEQGRLVRLLIMIWDRPGTLHTITEVFAQKRANIVEVHHTRSALSHRMGEASIEVEIETRGHEHTQEIIDALSQRGFHVERQS